MAKKNATPSKKELIYGQDDPGNSYQPKPINWKKTAVVLTILATIVTSIVMIWLFVFKGKEFLDYRKIAKSAYSDLLVEAEEDRIKDYSYYSSGLKKSVEQVTKDIKNIYETNNGYDATINGSSETDLKILNTKKVETITYGKTDYVFQFVTRENWSLQGKESFPEYFSNQVQIRIYEGKIAGIRFVGVQKNNGWIPNSYTDGLNKGGH